MNQGYIYTLSNMRSVHHQPVSVMRNCPPNCPKIRSTEQHRVSSPSSCEPGLLLEPQSGCWSGPQPSQGRNSKSHCTVFGFLQRLGNSPKTLQREGSEREGTEDTLEVHSPAAWRPHPRQPTTCPGRGAAEQGPAAPRRQLPPAGTPPTRTQVHRQDSNQPHSRVLPGHTPRHVCASSPWGPGK